MGEHGEERDDAFMANVRTHMRARIEETTRAGYDGALKRVAQWLVEDGHPELVDESGVIRYVTITREIQVLQVLSTARGSKIICRRTIHCFKRTFFAMGLIWTTLLQRPTSHGCFLV